MRCSCLNEVGVKYDKRGMPYVRCVGCGRTVFHRSGFSLAFELACSQAVEAAGLDNVARLAESIFAQMQAEARARGGVNRERVSEENRRPGGVVPAVAESVPAGVGD